MDACELSVVTDSSHTIPDYMMAAVLTGSFGADSLVVREVPVPALAPGEVLVRVSKSGICGSDVHFVLDGSARTAYTPIVLGHEASGRVVARAEGVVVPDLGTRVSIWPFVTCMTCQHCRSGRTMLCSQRRLLGGDREGTFCEYVAVPAVSCIPVPDGLSDELAAVATDCIATAYRAVVRRGGVRAGSTVAVWGTGGLGLAAVGLAKTQDAASVIAVDARPQAREWALETGADEALAPEDALARITALGGVDVALEFVGKQATAESAVRSLNNGGRAVIVGVGLEHLSAGRIMTFVLREREVVGSYGNEPSEVAECLALLASGQLSLPRAIGDVIPLSRIREGVERVHRGETGGSRIVVDLNGHDAR